jgi:hypothetical protein
MYIYIEREREREKAWCIALRAVLNYRPHKISSRGTSNRKLMNTLHCEPLSRHSHVTAALHSLNLLLDAVVDADGCAPEILAPAPHSVMLADGSASTVLALPSLSVMIAERRFPRNPCTCSALGDARRRKRLHSPCIVSRSLSVMIADRRFPRNPPHSVMLADGSASTFLAVSRGVCR